LALSICIFSLQCEGCLDPALAVARAATTGCRTLDRRATKPETIFGTPGAAAPAAAAKVQQSCWETVPRDRNESKRLELLDRPGSGRYAASCDRSEALVTASTRMTFHDDTADDRRRSPKRRTIDIDSDTSDDAMPDPELFDTSGARGSITGCLP
jgi:hypothetical protein